MERVVLKAPQGMVYTNGTVAGNEIHLAVGISAEPFYLISEEAYERAFEEAAAADYVAALGRFGVAI